MAARKPPLSEHQGDAPQTALAVLLSRAKPSVLARAFEVLRLEEDKHADERLALLIARALNPDHVFTDEQEQLIRGKSEGGLRAMKDRNELPEVMGTTVVGIQREKK